MVPLRLIAALLAPLAGGCLYTDPINRAPDARIVVESDGPYFAGEEPAQTIELNARKSADPDGDRVTFGWAISTRGPEDDRFTEVDRDSEPDVSVNVGGKGQILVVLTAYDEHGAKDRDTVTFDVQNRSPALELQIQGQPLASGAHLVGREVTAVVEASDPDGDEPTLDWRLEPADASNPEAVEWEEVTATEWRLVPDVPGLWTIAVEASDGDGTTSASESVLAVADAPPCLGATDPAAPGAGTYVLRTGDAPRRFSVLAVSDELDPYPPRADPLTGVASFRWLVASPETGGALAPVNGRDAPDLVVDPQAYSPGDRLSLRVEVNDRERREIACAPDRPTCSITGDDCIQRATWEVEIR